ncbi:FAD-dependent oxidoreductase [Ravibacter arvi]|uniref:FAD-dependent oxidoreductase n=1 Tax=Ravibacter arvi TaxID=2051041 RepID=A0ABP8LQ08_9BACT
MNRDGKNRSLWQDWPAPYQPLNSGGCDYNKVYDALIVGGGITGLTTGVLLQEAGLDCLLAEARTIGFGTSLGTTAHLNTLMDTPYPLIEKRFGLSGARLVAKAGEKAIALVETFTAETAVACNFERKTAWLVAATAEERQRLDEIREASLRAGLTAYPVSDCPVKLPFLAGCCFEAQGQVNAGAYLCSLAQRFEESGGIILEHTLVDETERETDYHKVSTMEGVIKARRLIYATHIPPGVNQFSVLCAPYRSYAVAFTLADGHYPDGLAYDMKEPYNYFRTQRVGDRDYVIAGGFDHKCGHEENTENVFRQLEAMVRAYFNVSEIAYKWSSQYFEPADGLPYIGRYPGREETFVATGFSGNGFTFGTFSAILISELIMSGESEFESLFSPSRLKPLASAKNLVMENADVVAEWLAGFWKNDKISLLTELAPGDARVVEWEGKSLAIYKSETGKIYAVNAVCPHFGCKVSWNNTERSWDCPCHGSRFSFDGSLLTGPALSGLQGRDLDES